MQTIQPPIPGVSARRLDPVEAAKGSRAVRQLVRGAQAGGVSLQYLYGAFGPKGKLIAAVFVVPQAGGTGLVFMSRVKGPEEMAALSGAVEACCSQLPRGKVKLAQGMLSRGDEPQAQALKAAGFFPLANLAYMQARVPVTAMEPPTPRGVELCTWDPAAAGWFVAALEASYIGTMDCPGLQGLRDTDDVLNGHRATGVFDPKLWTVALVEGRPAGVALLNRVPQAGCVELVYLGVAPEFRGRSLGSLLMRRALAQAARHGESLMTLAVDTANAPALNLYRRFGFHRTATKTVMVRPLRGGPSV